MTKWLISTFVGLVVATSLFAQEMTQEEIAAHILLWRGYRKEVPISEAIMRLEPELKKKYGDRQIPSPSQEQVMMGMMDYVRKNPKSEFALDVTRSIEARTLPRGSLLHYVGGTHSIKLGDVVFEIEELTYILYFGLHLDASTLAYGGRWRSFEFLKVPLSVSPKR